MYSDSHFHFHQLTEGDAKRGADILSQMAQNRVAFALDIGTKRDDLAFRESFMADCLDLIEDDVLKGRAEKMLYFSAGLWPEVDAINEREECVRELEEQIADATEGGGRFAKKLAAIGECGLDHHGDFDWSLIAEERDLFAMQLRLAKRLHLPVIIHSRDAFEDTIDVIKGEGYDYGVIHCYSYGLEEAKAFLDRGWYIAFGGAVTYTKKSKMYDMEQLLTYVPDDRLLLETDAPYLTPVPFRGTPNTPLFINYTYEFIAAKRHTGIDKLSKLVDENCKRLFSIK